MIVETLTGEDVVAAAGDTTPHPRQRRWQKQHPYRRVSSITRDLNVASKSKQKEFLRINLGDMSGYDWCSRCLVSDGLSKASEYLGQK